MCCAEADALVAVMLSLVYLVAVSLHNLSQRPAEQVVAHVTEVERLVGVRRRVLDHDERAVLSNWLLTKLRVSVDGIQEEIYTAVKEISDLRGYSLVLDRASNSGIIFGSPKIDISNEVLQKLGYSK